MNVIYIPRRKFEPINPYEGYVYIFRVSNLESDLNSLPTKIGFCHYKSGRNGHEITDNRLADIQRHHWEKLYKVFCSEWINDANIAEYEIHRKYEKFRIKGEWFNLTYNQVKNIKKLLMLIEDVYNGYTPGAHKLKIHNKRK